MLAVFRHRVTLLAAVAAVVCLSAGAAQAQTRVYNAASGALPETQGWNFVTFSSPSASHPYPSVSGGILHQGPTPYEDIQIWQRHDTAFDFDNGFTLEANIKVIASTYVPNVAGLGRQRHGYYVEAIDSRGRVFSMGLSSDGVAVNTDQNLSPTNGITQIPFNTTDGFHHYRLTVASGVGTLFIDGNVAGSTPLGSGVWAGSVDENRLYFGDGTGAGNSQTELRSVRFSSGPYVAEDTSAVPEPGSLALMLPALAGLALLRARRRTAATSQMPT